MRAPDLRIEINRSEDGYEVQYFSRVDEDEVFMYERRGLTREQMVQEHVNIICIYQPKVVGVSTADSKLVLLPAGVVAAVCAGKLKAAELTLRD